MTRRRLALALAALACGAALAALEGSCAQVLGVDDKVHDVVDDMCACNDVFGFLGTKPECETYLEGQIDGLTEGTRATWLEAYAGKCHTCPTDLGCFYEGPLCQKASCSVSQECCSFHDGGGCDDAGTCR